MNKKQHLRPAMTDVGRGPERARITYVRDGHTFVLKVEGDWLPTTGVEGAFWARMLTAGSVEPVPKAAAARAKTKKVED